MLCPNCGKVVQKGLPFCVHCGKPLASYKAKKTRSRKILITVGLTISIAVIAILTVYSVIVPYVNSNSQFCAGVSISCDFKYAEFFQLGFTQDTTNIVYNITATAMTNGNGVGPSYLLNGESDAGYWYQIGLDYDWDSLHRGFSLGLDLYASPNSGHAYSNVENGELSFSGGGVKGGDIVQISLGFKGNQVIASAIDWNSSATASHEFGSYGGTHFVGSSSPANFFTGIMTEWHYNVTRYYNPRQVTYSNRNSPLKSGWMCISETPASSSIATTNVFASCTPVLNFSSNPNSLLNYTYEGATIYANAYEFTTG